MATNEWMTPATTSIAHCTTESFHLDLRCGYGSNKGKRKAVLSAQPLIMALIGTQLQNVCLARSSLPFTFLIPDVSPRCASLQSRQLHTGIFPQPKRDGQGNERLTQDKTHLSAYSGQRSSKCSYSLYEVKCAKSSGFCLPLFY